MWAADPTAPGALAELYDHRNDTGHAAGMWDVHENANVAQAHLSVVAALSDKIRAFYAKFAADRERRALGRGLDSGGAAGEGVGADEAEAALERAAAVALLAEGDD